MEELELAQQAELLLLVDAVVLCAQFLMHRVNSAAKSSPVL